jgi:hypothetical protein
MMKEAVMAETWSGEFYCVKCKEKREASGEVRVNDKGTRMAKAVCPVCGTTLNRILGKACAHSAQLCRQTRRDPSDVGPAVDVSPALVRPCGLPFHTGDRRA